MEARQMNIRYDDKTARFVMDGVDPMPENPVEEAMLWQGLVSRDLVTLNVEMKIAEAVIAGRRRGLTDAEIVHQFVWEPLNRELSPWWTRLLKAELLLKVLGRK